MKNLIKKSFSRFCYTYDREAYLQKRASKYLLDFAGSIEGKILDLGCGTGFIGEFTDKKLIGLDISQSMLKIAKSKGYTVVQGDMENLPFKNNSFNTVLSNFSIHWADISKVLDEVYRVLNSDGQFVFNIPIEDTLSGINKILGKKFFKFLTKDEVLNQVSKKFEIENYRDINLINKLKNGYELLLHLHKTGVSINPKEDNFKTKREIIKKFKDYNQPICLNYRLLYIKAKKK